MSLSMNAIPEDFSDDPIPMFTNAPRTFVCEHRGRTPKKSHKSSSPSADKRTAEIQVTGLSLSRYQNMGINSDSFIPSPIFPPMEMDSGGSISNLENLVNATKALKSDVYIFNESFALKKRGWDQLKMECISVLNELNICDTHEPVDRDWTISQRLNSETVRLGIEFLQEQEPEFLIVRS